MSDEWIETYTGKQFFIDKIRAEDICIEDIAHSLALICRFGGQCAYFYSVAQHSVNVAELVNKNKLAALLHDASEAYLGDMPAPWLSRFPSIATVHYNLKTLIYGAFGISAHFDSDIEKADMTARATEVRVMMQMKHKWVDLKDIKTSSKINVYPLDWKFVEQLFLLKFKEYSNA